MRSRAATLFVFLLLCVHAVPAVAQSSSASLADPATGESYHVELGGYLWSPSPSIEITSEALGIPGSRIDFVNELGLESSTFKQFKAVLRPARQHKFRFEYTPIKYEAEAILKRDVIFNGIVYPIELPVDTSLSWKAFRFGYEWDFLYKDRGFVGLLLEAKYTQVEATLQNAIDLEYVRARAPIPAIGVIGRGYVAPNISLTGEFSASGFPGSIREGYSAKYYDFDFYGTVNFTNYVGAQAGYRTFNVEYQVDKDEGDLKLAGWYFGGVVRF